MDWFLPPLPRKSVHLVHLLSRPSVGSQPDVTPACALPHFSKGVFRHIPLRPSSLRCVTDGIRTRDYMFHRHAQRTYSCLSHRGCAGYESCFSVSQQPSCGQRLSLTVFFYKLTSSTRGFVLLSLVYPPRPAIVKSNYLASSNLHGFSPYSSPPNMLSPYSWYLVIRGQVENRTPVYGTSHHCSTN